MIGQIVETFVFYFCICLLIKCFIFNVTLFYTIYKQPKKSALPTVYIYNMTVMTMIVTYQRIIGYEHTLFTTFSYFHPHLTAFTMTLNRIFALVTIRATVWFSNSRIWIYTGIHMTINFVLLFIPYLSKCRVMFDAIKMAYIPDCAPERHPITKFCNTYAAVLPLTTLSLNIIIFIYFKLQRSEFYQRVVSWGKGSRTLYIPDSILKSKKRTEAMLIIQSFVTAFCMSIYDFTSIWIRLNVEYYESLEARLKLIIYYLRYAIIPLHVFVVYFVFSPTTRSLVLEQFRAKKNPRSISLNIVSS
ncbi:unnamed protein product [Caenorhabditis bovis]|uniref:Uncharacterized protein n=1 Tax=Caenorhabditis bovis TaxID=2654633 RepID=A0A8S1EM60_9PELO|nr:unnamed protein product [Caenorhabditis bovis]